MNLNCTKLHCSAQLVDDELYRILRNNVAAAANLIENFQWALGELRNEIAASFMSIRNSLLTKITQCPVS